MKEFNTHNAATDIVEVFENILDKYNITIPSPEDNERGEDNAARLYGSVYSNLLDEIEGMLIAYISEAKDADEIISYVYNN